MPMQQGKYWQLFPEQRRFLTGKDPFDGYAKTTLNNQNIKPLLLCFIYADAELSAECRQLGLLQSLKIYQ